MSADELASTLEVSSSAVRQHLDALRSAGLIASRQYRRQPGRPADRYHATELNVPLFVTTGVDVSTEILRSASTPTRRRSTTTTSEPPHDQLH